MVAGDPTPVRLEAGTTSSRPRATEPALNKISSRPSPSPALEGWSGSRIHCTERAAVNLPTDSMKDFSICSGSSHRSRSLPSSCTISSSLETPENPLRRPARTRAQRAARCNQRVKRVVREQGAAVNSSAGNDSGSSSEEALSLWSNLQSRSDIVLSLTEVHGCAGNPDRCPRADIERLAPGGPSRHPDRLVV